MEMLNNVALVTPKTFTELVNTIDKSPNYKLFAGGTNLMRDSSYYPAKESITYIYLRMIPDLHKVIHADRFFEVGSMVTLEQLLNLGSFSFSKNMYKALGSIGTTVVKNQITIGGSLGCPKTRYFLSTILSALNAQVEVRFISRDGLFNRLRVKSRWMYVSKLYDQNGNFLFNDKAIITRVRIPNDQNFVQAFKSIGNPILDEDGSISMAFEYNISQDSITNPSFCISFIKNGFFQEPEFANVLHSLKFPLLTKSILRCSVELERLIKEKYPNVTKIQAERARRLLVATLFEANSNYLDS